MPTYASLLFALSCSCLVAQEPPPASSIVTPIRIDLAPLMAAAERATPVVPPGVETWINLPGTAMGNPAYRFNLYRDPLLFNLNGKRLGIHTTVNYWMEVGLRMKGWVKGMASCGRAPEPFRRARLGLTAELGLKPDWGLDLKITPEDPLRMDSCQVSFLGYDITDKVLGGMKDAMNKATQSMEQQLKASTLLRQRAEAIWLQAQQPVELGHDLHLLLNPEQVRLSPWTSQGKELTITPEILVRPALILGRCTPAAPKPLPPLDLINAPSQPGFHMRVQTDLSFEQATAQMAKEVVGKHFETPKGNFDITKLALRSKGNQILIEVGLKGRVNGTLALVGRPVFDESTGQVRLADLDYTLETKSWITQFGEWMYRGTLHKLLMDKCGGFLNENFKNLKVQVQQGLNRSITPDLSMSGTVDSLTLPQVEVLPDHLHVVAQLNGQIQIAVKAAL